MRADRSVCKPLRTNFIRWLAWGCLAAPLTMLAPAESRAALVELSDGQTNVLLDTATLESAASLVLSGVSGEVVAPGNLGAASVAFGVNPRTTVAPALPTTFAYDSADFAGTFAGAIEHAGSVFFNANAVEVGDFSIAFSSPRAGTLGGKASGFYVASTTGISAILFDIENPSSLAASEAGLTVAANLLVSPEFAEFLQSNGLATTDLSGADVGDALVEAVPEPSTLALASLGLVGLMGVRVQRWASGC